jgi:hypothetical protein
MSDTLKMEWGAFVRTELARLTTALAPLGYALDETQVHLGGERYLMLGKRDVGGGGVKFVLTGKRVRDGKRVVVKTSSSRDGKLEIARERTCRENLLSLPFSYNTFIIPEELLYTTRGGTLIFITEYIPQEPFFEKSNTEQFALVLSALKVQEGVHATTYSHAKHIEKVFGISTTKDYVSEYAEWMEESRPAFSHVPDLEDALLRGSQFLETHQETLERYCGFLTHADFVPNNFRVADGKLYLLDVASLHFGNKYESWARLTNFMARHNPALERGLIQYVRDNRSAEEYLSLRLMRIHKLGFLLSFYATALSKSAGNDRALTLARLSFWATVLSSLLENTLVPEATVLAYAEKADALRSPEEKARQAELLGSVSS